MSDCDDVFVSEARSAMTRSPFGSFDPAKEIAAVESFRVMRTDPRAPFSPLAYEPSGVAVTLEGKRLNLTTKEARAFAALVLAHSEIAERIR